MGSRRAKRAHGRVQSAVSAKHGRPSAGISKAARRSTSRAQRKSAIANAARHARQSVATQSPLLIGVIAVSSATDDELLKLSSLMQSCEVPKNSRPFEIVSVRRSGASDRDVLISALDLAKVADLVLLVYSGRDDVLDNVSIDILTALRAQGIPEIYSIAIGEGANDATLRKLRGRQLAAESLGDDHTLRPIYFNCEDGDDAEAANKAAMRRVLAKQPRTISWRSKYGYMRVEHAEAKAVQPDEGMLILTGWIRGRGFSANALVHITGIGAFSVETIVDAATGETLSRRTEEAEPVESVAEVDGIMGEQTWPPEVEDGDKEDDTEQKEMIMDDEDIQSDEDGIPEDDVSGGADGNSGDDDLDDEEMSIDEEEIQRVREAAKTDAMFPDEVDTPIDQQARVRFARYRGLKSLRTGEWDPKEQLPVEYASLFQFRNLAATRKRVLEQARKEKEEGDKDEALNFARSGKKVEITLIQVSGEICTRVVQVVRDGRMPVVASGMLRHENRRSVVHFGLRRVDEEEDGASVKAKSRLELHCGFVRFEGRPMFSEHNANCDKHKMERFFVHGRHIVASFYGPAIFAPAPALLFQPGGELIATGNALGADPDRIMLKRIILTGYPFKTQKRRTVVKFMFFNPEDIRWFKPVELWTKLGRSGHILEPVGTHGHMKCIFDNVTMHHDTVCMTLYKRVYPKLIEQQDRDRESM